MSTVLNGARVRQSYSVVLMARLVDRDGRLVGPSAIDSIHCSIYQVRGTGAREVKKEALLLCQPLCVPEVIVDALQRGPNWDADEAGFNFRHRFVIPWAVTQLSDGSRFEVRYMFTQMNGERTAVRFRIRAMQHD